jgi:DNA-binding transcriptional MerR regulator
VAPRYAQNSSAGPSERPTDRGFSIGEAAAMVGVSTHVLRSWERRLALDLNNRTASNQRRYRIGDIHRLVAIRQLHEKSGLPLVESAARALAPKEEASDQTTGLGSAGIDEFWAGLIDTFPELLLVIDEAGKIRAANEVARARLNVRPGTSFSRLAPLGWRRAYDSIRTSRGSHKPGLLAMRGVSGTIFMDFRVQSIGRPDGPIVLIGRGLRVDAPVTGAQAATKSLDG